ncbi:hypothetical protein [Streptomyces sp. MMBL 11-3]|uniref:hypothetical protein n=1 Tax=Streptomyces sp. MMBL 11-3 TaxID=3382639 RepID=UPI0039B4428D
MLSTAGPSALVSIAPVAVGYGIAPDGSLPRFDLTEAELKQLGRGLYGLLAQFEGYLIAMVGWDPEGFLDVDDLAADWPEELAEGSLTGLVLADHLNSRLPLGPAWVPFRPGCLWLPYAQQESPGS